MAPFNIDAFNTVLDKYNGVQKPSLFQVTMNLPNLLQPVYATPNVQDLTLLCLESSIPGPAIDAIANFRYGIGMYEKMPFNGVVSDQTLVFIGDGQAFVHNFFRDWQRSIFEYVSEDIVGEPDTLSPNRTSPGMLPYMLNYKDDYATTINIATYDNTGNQNDSVTLYSAYPIAVGDIRLAWGETDRFMLIPVTFTFKDIGYDAKFIPNGLGVLNSLVSASGLFGVAAGILNSAVMGALPLIK